MRFDAHEGKRMFNKRLTPGLPAIRRRMPTACACGQKKSRG
jgi:hypothetical protein